MVTALFNSPITLLVATGVMLGLLAPLAGMAGTAGIHPFLWAALISLVPGLCLGLGTRRENWARRDLALFGAISGLFAYVIPNAILFSAIPHIGSGLAGLMFALSPVATAALSVVFRVRPPSRTLLGAVALGCCGAVLIVAGRNALALPDAPRWLLIALLVPLSLAIGNVYRTARWPTGAPPAQIGAASNLAAALPLLLLAGANGGLDGSALLAHWPLAIAQWAASLAMFLTFFRLQWIGGPTYLSQIGYVAAAVSLAIGTLVMGENYPWQVWLGAALILLGLAATLLERRGA